MLNEEDNNLISQYLKGEEKSLELLIAKYLKPIYGFVYNFISNQTDAQDIVQEVFIKVWKHLKRFDQNKSFKTWLFSIAKNTIYDFLRKKKTIPFSDLENEDGDNPVLDNLADDNPLPDELFERADLAEFLKATLEKIPPNYRLVLNLYYQDQFNFREIAEILNESIDTVKSRHRRALILLNKILLKEPI
jgi:RNA polymerase sigma-70 factor, ECF subfamily